MEGSQMSEKPKTREHTAHIENNSALLQLQEAGFGKMVGMSVAWMETLSNMSAEMIGFAADRIKEDVKTQHDILQCKNVAELQHVQAQFMQKAMDQYQEETGKLVEMSSKVLTPNEEEKAT
jgi:hypothetical protein